MLMAYPLASARFGSSLGKKPGSLNAVKLRNMSAKINSAATMATRAHEMLGPTLGATNPKKMPHGATMMRMVPNRLFQSVPKQQATEVRHTGQQILVRLT